MKIAFIFTFVQLLYFNIFTHNTRAIIHIFIRTNYFGNMLFFDLEEFKSMNLLIYIYIILL